MRLPGHIVESLANRYAGTSVCVTGGAGFIGGHVVDALLSVGASITVIDDLSNSTLDHLAELIDLEPDRVRFVHGSILEDEALADAVDGAGVVIHLAAVGSVPLSIDEPQRTMQVNAMGTLRVLEACRVAGATRVVYAASSSAYGDDPTLPKVETQLPRPMSPYAASKLTGEQCMAVWAHCYGLSTISLRYFNVFGPRQRADSAYAAVIAAFSARLLAGDQPVIFGDGEQSRDFTSVTNAVLATLLAGASDKPLRGEVVNVGTGRRTTLNELAELMARRCRCPHLVPVHESARAGDVPHSLADITAARTLLGYEPVTSLDDGLDETISWYRKGLACAGGEGSGGEGEG